MSLFNHRQNKMGPDPYSNGKWCEIEIFSDGSKWTAINDPSAIINQTRSGVGSTGYQVTIKPEFRPADVVPLIVDFRTGANVSTTSEPFCSISCKIQQVGQSDFELMQNITLLQPKAFSFLKVLVYVRGD